MARPYQKANIPGPEMGTSVTDPTVMANLLKSPMRKVLVIGAESLTWELDGKKIADFLIEISNKIDCTVFFRSECIPGRLCPGANRFSMIPIIQYTQPLLF